MSLSRYQLCFRWHVRISSWVGFAATYTWGRNRPYIGSYPSLREIQEEDSLSNRFLDSWETPACTSHQTSDKKIRHPTSDIEHQAFYNMFLAPALTSGDANLVWKYTQLCNWWRCVCTAVTGGGCLAEADTVNPGNVHQLQHLEETSNSMNLITTWITNYKDYMQTSLTTTRE